MATGEALQHLANHVKRMDKEFFTTSDDSDAANLSRSSDAYFQHETLEHHRQRGPGFSSGTVQNIWVDNPRELEDDLAANRAAVVRALEGLVRNGSWATRTMASVKAQ
ncbi:hypothetical protein GSI_02552 [Ganoderma sinense ZZ0214-1]|uniref:Uncharacterized protein n=1 Tax=Ganoderma sinense ZZ0214-1 TaxID=1077348 RepID=A0A2G8SLV9_9APHY|nr:hypothetical protein GSI_02552 [Ganoderma sinense ZZ0214-1]